MVSLNLELLKKIKKIGTYCFVAFLVLLCISVFIPNSPVTGLLLKLFYAVQNMNSLLAALIIFLVNVICVCFMIPSTPVTIFSGLRFGVFFGTCLAQLGCTVGCIIVYWITRFFLYETVEGFIKNNKFMKSIQKIVEKHGIFFITLLRASPVFPFPVLNYVLSPVVSFPSYSIGSFIGLIPSNFIVCYISVSITEIADAFVKNTLSGSSTFMVIVIICLTIGSLVAITIYLKVQLKKVQMEEETAQELLDEEHQMKTNESENIDNEMEIDTQNVIEIDDIQLDKNQKNEQKEMKKSIEKHEEVVTIQQISIVDDGNQENEINVGHVSNISNITNVNMIDTMTSPIVDEIVVENKRITSPPFNHSISFNQNDSIHSVIIDDEDTYSHNTYAYDNSYIGKNALKSHIMVGGDEEEDIIQYDDDNDTIIIDPNA